MPQLPQSSGPVIELWCSFMTGVIEPERFATYEQLLDATERNEQHRFRFSRDHQRFVLTRALVRTVLSQYAAFTPQQWRFERGAHGRPEVARTLAGAPPLWFNVSHTPGLIVVAVSQHAALGVDVEALQPAHHALSVARSVLSANEWHALQTLPDPQQVTRMLEYWTLKESYVKACGLGLSLPLHHVDFAFNDQRALTMSIPPQFDSEPGRWQFWQLQLANDYVLAVCAQRDNEQPLQLCVRETAPFMPATPLDYSLLRSSLT